MLIRICAIGAMKNAPEKALITKYLTQLPWKVEIREIDIDSKLPTPKRRALEAEKLRAAMASKTRSVAIALDSRGKQLTSEKFADLISAQQNDRVDTLSFLIGGQDGIDESLLKESQHIIAFGSCTWPHLLARALLCEQLYRAYTIHTNHPYHSGH